MTTATKRTVATVTVSSAMALVVAVMQWHEADCTAWIGGYNAKLDGFAHRLWTNAVAMASQCTESEVARVRRLVGGVIADAIDAAVREAAE